MKNDRAICTSRVILTLPFSGEFLTLPALHPYSAGGAYVNFMMDEGEDRIRATYGKNYDRLARIKKRYDPTNFVHMNQNIKPAK